MSYQLGIIGGVGSEASAYFYDKLIKHTKVNKDQDHLDMIILNHATIPDRTAHILDNTKPSPLEPILDDIKILNDLQVSLIMIPCNTSHYYFDIFQANSKVPIYHMIEETIAYLASQNIHKVGIWATSGTINSKLYQQACAKYELSYEIPSEENQALVMSLIYDDVKAGKAINMDNFKTINKEMLAKEVDCVILACTELSILKEKLQLDNFFCDPLDIACNKILQTFKKEAK